MSRGWRVFVIVGVYLALAGRLRGPEREALAQEAPAKSPQATADDPATADDAAPAEATPAPEKYNLVYKFQPNQVVRYEVSSESEIKTQVKNDSETVRNSSRSKRHYAVKAANENGSTGGATGDLELSIDWVHMVASFESPERGNSAPVEFQSDDPQKHPPQFEKVLATVGKPTAIIRFSDKGKPIKVLKGAIPAPPPAAPQLAKGPAAPPVADPTPESYFLPFPDEPVSVGETWKDRFDILLVDNDKRRIKITIQRNYRLVAVKDGRATIELRTAVLTPVQDPAIAGQLIQREITGNLVFDLERGIVLSRETGVDNTVVGPFGPNSSMRAKSKYHEKLLEEEATADREAETGAVTK
jgi:hypothetical protein